jgi:hypothetical protein
MDASRAVRIAGSMIVAWGLLYLRFSSGIAPQTEVDPMVHWALLPIALLIAAANAAAEVNHSGSVPRRDLLWGLCGALVSFAVLHWVRVV